jgi:hypothetical protein
MPKPIALTDEQMAAIWAAAYPVPPDRRAPFLEMCACELAKLPAIGDGAVHRVVTRVQRLYLDPPLSTEEDLPPLIRVASR